MKKFIFSALAAIGLLLSPACSDDNEALSGSGNEALVSFNVNLADGISTKAISDGKRATNLVVEVYEADATDSDEEVFRSDTETLTNLKGQVSFTLVKGKKYNIIFWAQNQAPSTTTGNYYDVSDLRHIGVNYTNMASNNEDRDAFLCVKPNFSVTGPFETTVELRRPFAQVNFMVPETDINAAKAAGFDFENATTSVTFKQVATKLNTLANTVSDEQDVTFAAAAIPFAANANNISSETDKLPINGTDYYYLATNYILVNTNSAEANAQALTNAYLSISELGTDHKVNVSNLPVQWNHRTNIYGNLLTTQSTFHVEINPIYEDPDHGLAETVDVANVTDIAAKIKAGARTITCAAAISEDVTISIPKVFEAYSGSAETDSKVVIRFTGAITADKININYGEEGTQSVPHFVDINANGGNWFYDLGESTVTMNGGTVENVTSTTSENTLVIAAGLTITGSITAKQGGVQILGKVLGQNLGEGQAAINIPSTNTSGNLEIHGEVGGNINAGNNATINIMPTASITGNVTATGNINVQGSVTGDVKSTGTDATVSIDGSATVGGSVTGENVEVSPTADVNDNKINQNNEGSKTTTKIGTPEELIAFAAKVNDGVTTYEGKTVELTQNIDLNNMFWTPIGLNADDSKKFQGTFDGQNHTIRNLTVQQDADYHAAGFFGALNGTARDFTIDGATISNLSEGRGSNNSTDNGTAVVAGSIYNTGAIEGVTVRNANVNGNRYVGGIAGYVYGSITNCTVESSTITSTPDDLTGSYDNGDKAGGIAGAFWDENTYEISGCKVNNVTIQAYRDLGGIVGFAGDQQKVTNYLVRDVTLIQDNTHAYKDDAQTTVGAIIGRPTFDGDYASAVTKKALVSKLDQLQTALAYGASEIDLISKLQIASGENVVLNLNNHKINNTTKGVAISVEGELTINGDGEVYGGHGGNNQAVHAVTGGKVTINGGTFSVGPDASNEGNSCIESSGGDILIYGGKFSSEAKYAGKYWVLNLNDAVENKITVYGGSFVNFDPSQTGTEPANHSDNFVASGYTVSSTTEDGKTIYTVTQSTGK